MAKKIDQTEVQLKQTELQLEQAKNFGMLIDKLVPVAERYLTAKMEKLEAPKFKWSYIVVCILLVILLVGSMILAYYGKISSENFAFLMGTVVGYLMTFMKDVIIGNGE